MIVYNLNYQHPDLYILGIFSNTTFCILNNDYYYFVESNQWVNITELNPFLHNILKKQEKLSINKEIKYSLVIDDKGKIIDISYSNKKNIYISIYNKRYTNYNIIEFDNNLLLNELYCYNNLLSDVDINYEIKQKFKNTYSTISNLKLNIVEFYELFIKIRASLKLNINSSYGLGDKLENLYDFKVILETLKDKISQSYLSLLNINYINKI